MAFKAAQLLKNAGYRIIFGSMPAMEKLIHNHGFEYLYLPYCVVVPLEQHLLMQKEGIKMPDNKECLKTAHKNFDVLNKQITELKPDIVLLDKHLPPDKAFYYKRLGSQVVFICVMPDPSRFVNVPPFCSGFIPWNNFFSEKYIDYLWFKKKIKGKLKFFLNSLVYPNNDLRTLKELFDELNLDLNQIRETNKGIQRIILSATDFDFLRPQEEGVYHVGPLIDFPEEDYQSADTRYEAVKQKLNKTKISVIYCTLGTLADFCTPRKIQLYKKIREVALLSPNDVFVISIGDDLNNSDLLPQPRNMFVFKSLPQKDFLRYCTVMINHGGLNSITECIFSEVPVIAYPPSRQADHTCNAAKVVYHGIGLRGKIRWDSPNDILKKIEKIKENYDWYQENIRKMKTKFEEKNNSAQIVEIISQLLES
jgi:zeaxanthin glucosyltransferase